ncbi:MAG: formate--tetrahydrofolate ligase [Terriglobia bacterium]
MLPITDIAEGLKIPSRFLEAYGKYTAKIKLDLLKQPEPANLGKLILVTAITPTEYGEGKTVTSIGLAQALRKCGKKSIATLREPSLGPVFGVKGGATGGGKSKVLPSEMINLHFNGDFHAVTSAHNLLSALVDSHLYYGNELQIDPDTISWPRTIDVNDRVLRHIIVGLGGKINGVPRETGFVITAASEIMAILALANSHEDFRRRLGEIVIGLDRTGGAVRASDLGATGSMMVLLNQAILPNLVQTTENTPALVHAGPFANIAHGTSSVLSQKMALRLADYVVNESGFGADLGAEKYLDIVMPCTGIKPSVAVVIASVRALMLQGSQQRTSLLGDREALKKGLCNLGRHIENLSKFNLPQVVAINRFASDTPEEIKIVQDYCRSIGVESAPSEVFEKGGEGGIELAQKVITAAESSKLGPVRSLYPPDLAIEEKIAVIAREIYGAKSITMEGNVRKRIQRLQDLGFGHLPVCVAKTQYSLSDNPKLLGVPKDWTLTVSDVRLSAGAGFVVVVAGNMLLMPGLPKVPQAMKLDVDGEGNIIGMS